MEATTNCVREFCQLKQGERVLIVSEFDTDPLVTSAFAAAATQLGGEVAQLTTKPFSPGGYERGTPNDMLVGAFEKADVVIACTYFEFAHAERTFFAEIGKRRVRVASVLMGATPGSLITGGRFPVGLFVEIGKKAQALMQDARSVTYRTASGTDLTFEGLDGLGYTKPLEPGGWGIFPPMGINFYPRNTNGTLVFDEATITGRPAAPVKITVLDNFVTNVESESEADVAAIHAFANGRYYVRHAVVGLNPKVRMANAPQFERERAAGTAYVGVDGTGPTGQVDRSKPGFAHLDCILDTPTVTADGRTLVRNRRLLLLDDPDIIAAAKSYGDPVKLLAQNPFLW
jgi:leucyl aminopeptidase (aminopeptidase T)